MKVALMYLVLWWTKSILRTQIQWFGLSFLLQISEKIEENMDRLRMSMSIWDDILTSKDEIDGWSNNSVPQVAESISNLNNSLRAEEFLKEFEVKWLHLHIVTCGASLTRLRKHCTLLVEFILFFKTHMSVTKLLTIFCCLLESWIGYGWGRVFFAFLSRLSWNSLFKVLAEGEFLSWLSG